MNEKNNIVRPTGLKGNQALDRMRELMGTSTIKESVNPSVIEITKKGPDGKIYAIVRENHEYYIKVTDKTSNLVSENFNYIGGLQNKKDKAYPSYAKAIKMLNLKFISINEALAQNGKINVFLNDNLLGESMKANAPLSASKSFDKKDDILDKKGDKLEYDADEDTENHGDNVAKDGKADDFDEVKLNENEEAIDEMIDNEASYEDGDVEEIKESKKGYSISRAIADMDNIIESVNPNSEIEGILEKLNETEKKALLAVLKKKA